MLIRNPKEIQKFLSEHRHEMDTPQCYLGTEPNTHNKDWNDPKLKLRVLFVSCSRYEDFRGNQTIPLLYQMLNDREDILCDRAFFPNTEKEYKLFRKYRIPIFGLETKRSMGEYDIVMTSLSFLPPWINFPLMLDMSGIPSFRVDRDKSNKSFRDGYPLIMIGGSAMYGNFSVAYPVVDLIYLGDAEPGLFPLLDALMQDESLSFVQRQFDYILCPEFYFPSYYDEIFDQWIIDGRMPGKLKIIRQKKLDDAPALVKPIPSFTDTTMGLGEIEISRGCRGVCAFCGIGWKYRPYRERSRKKMVELMRENMLNSGATTLCPIATEFAYYGEKQQLIRDLLGLSYYVDPLSMRVDAFIDDPEFDEMLADRGMNQLALGVEAPSQRLRDRLMKGITEEDILKACEIALSRGFKRIKFFMISNIDEEWKDFEEFFSLLWKVRNLEVPSKKKGTRYGWDIGIICSWTPLFVEPCTPLQWKKPTIKQRKDWKRVDEVLRGKKNPETGKLEDGLGAKFKLGIKNSEDFLWTMQMMHLGDTRFATALVDATLRLKRPFYVSFTRSMKEELTKSLKSAGLKWKWVLRERGKDETFPWDIVDRGVSKESLRKVYDKIVSGWTEGVRVHIRPPSDKTRHEYRALLGKTVKPLHWYLVRYEYPSDYSIVPNTHVKAVFHRAAYQLGFPVVINSMHFFSDRDARNWYDSCDFFAVSTQREVTKEEFIHLNKEFFPFRIVDTLYVGNEEDKRPSWNKYYSRYTVGAKVSEAEARELISIYDRLDSVVVSVPSTRYFSGTFSKKKLDMRQAKVFGEARVVSDWGMPYYCQLVVELGHEVGIRYFLQALFYNTAFSKILRFGVTKENLMLNGRVVL